MYCTYIRTLVLRDGNRNLSVYSAHTQSSTWPILMLIQVCTLFHFGQCSCAYQHAYTFICRENTHVHTGGDGFVTVSVQFHSTIVID